MLFFMIRFLICGLTINVPLFKKMRAARDNLGVKKVEAPSKCPEKGLKKLLSQKKKNYVPNFLKQRDIGNFMSFCNHGPSTL
jgi:hypothetical protein